jgi:hypothetical protein
MSRMNPMPISHMLARALPACVVGGMLLILLSLAACAGDAPGGRGATDTPSATAITSTPVPTDAPATPAAERITSDEAIPSGVYAMMDWGRAAGAGEGKAYPWVQAGHYAFTWRQVNPERGVFDWDLVDRWLATEAGAQDNPTGKRVGLGVNAYEGGAGDAMPQWVVQDYALPGYAHSYHAVVAASEHETTEWRPALSINVRDPATGQEQTIHLQYGVDGFVHSADTWIGASDPEANHGAESALVLGGGGRANLLLGFQPATVPASARVVSARLVLHVLQWADGATDASLPVAVYAVRRSWQPASATWLSPQAGQEWTIRGANGYLEAADRDREPLGVSAITGPGVVEISLDPAAIQSWIDAPAENLGLLVKQQPADVMLPRYWDAGYLAAFSEMVHALADRYADDPRVAWVEISAGIYGETTPANEPALKWACAEAGLTSDVQEPAQGVYSWVETVIQIIDIYREAFPQKPLFLQYSNNFDSVSERGVYVPYAVERGIGLKHNGLYPDSIDGATYGGPAVGTYNIMFTYSETVPVAWEFQVFPRTEANVYWAMLNALDKRADFVMVQKDAITLTELIPVFEFANTYLGKAVDTTPDAWVALRETERPAERWNTQHGNFSFYLSQSDLGPAGKTIPLWKVTDDREGLFARSTDQATANRYMYFDIDDRYFAGGSPLALEVVYLDRGRDSWHVEYDAGQAGLKALNSVEKGDSGQWKSQRYTLIDAQMAGGIEGYDFRIDCEMDGNEIVHMVRISVLDG